MMMLGRLGQAWRQLRGHATSALPPPRPDDPPQQALWGMAQPMHGLRFLLRHPAQLRVALVPVGWLALFCAAAALFNKDGEPTPFPVAFYHVFAVLAPVPSILFGNHYARLAAAVHWQMGLGPCEPRLMSIPQRAYEAAKGAAVVAVAVAPFVAALAYLPLLGKVLAGVLAGAWALFWIVIEALDSARVVLPGRGGDGPPRDPWFVRVCLGLGEALPLGLGVPVRAFARFCRWLARPWAEELAVAEERLAACGGFAVTTALLLAVPGLNLFFRPIILCASVHLLGQLRAPPEAKSPEVT
jgi:hypothetical protein